MQIFVCFILTLCLKSLQWLLFFNQFVRFISCDGEFSALRSTMELQIPHAFLKRSVLKVSETISKSQHWRFQSKSRRYWKFKIVVFIWELQQKNDFALKLSLLLLLLWLLLLLSLLSSPVLSLFCFLWSKAVVEFGGLANLQWR